MDILSELGIIDYEIQTDKLFIEFEPISRSQRYQHVFRYAKTGKSLCLAALEVNMELKEKIRVIEGFPTEGISFKDITTLIKDKDDFKVTVDTLVDQVKQNNINDIDIIVGPEARGFIFGTAMAYALGTGFCSH